MLVCTFLCPFLQRYDYKLPNLTFHGVRKQATTKLLFLFLNLDMVPKYSTPVGLAYIWQSKWVGIITIKTERTQIHFLNEVLVAVASLDLKVPNIWEPGRAFISKTTKTLDVLVLPYKDSLHDSAPPHPSSKHSRTKQTQVKANW